MKKNARAHLEASPRPRRILMLRPIDEMRHPYENALEGLCSEVISVDSYESLLAYPGEDEPLMVIVDLDCLKGIEHQLVELRGNFPGSDLIALSGIDSAQLALLCIRSGFTEFLLKPTSPEELAWATRKSLERNDLSRRLDPKADVLRAVTQISTCTTPALVRVATLEYLRHFLRSEGAAWLSLEGNGRGIKEVLCSLPKSLATAKVTSQLPRRKDWGAIREPEIWKASSHATRRILLPCQNRENGMVFLWGVERRMGPESLAAASGLVEHSELSLLNLHKFDQIKQQTFVDDLTGLYNSRYLKFAISNAMLKCKQPGQCFSVLFIDVDHFKKVNDLHNHLVGSEFLVAIGKTIKSAVRNIDPVFRYGGDEFVVILQETSLEGAREIGERIRKNIERRVFVVKGQRLQTTVSIGVATYPDHALERESLLKLADEAMYAAKKESRNAVHLAYGLPNTEKIRKTG